MRPEYLQVLKKVGIGSGAGAASSVPLVHLNKDVDPTKDNYIQGAILGSIIGGSMGAGMGMVRFLKNKRQGSKSIGNLKDIKNADHLEDIPVK